MLDNIKAFFVFVLVFAFASNGYEAIESQLYPEVKEAYWYLMLLGVAALFLLLTPAEALSNLPKPIFVWLLLFLLTIVFSYAFSSQSEVAKNIAILLVKSLSVFISMFILITNQRLLKVGFASLFLVLLISVGSNILEFFDESIEWSYIPGRSAGWYYDANLSARNIVMSLLFASLIIPKKLLWPTILVAAIGVILTFSRGGWLMLFMAIVGISLLRTAKPGKKISLLDIKPSSFLAMVFGGIIASLLLALFISGEAYELVKDTPFEEYLREDTIGRLSGDFDDNSSNERMNVLMTAMEMGVKNPLTGAGLARTHEWHHNVAAHNDYATLFAERGILGVASYLFLLWIIWSSGGGYARLFTMILAFSSITSHTTFEQPATYIFIAFALLYKEEVPPVQQMQQPPPSRM